MAIRKAVLADSPVLTTHLMLAMEEIVYKFIGGRNVDDAKNLLKHFIETPNNQYSFQNFWVATERDVVIGSVNLYDGAELHQLRSPVVDYIKARFIHDFIPEDETQAGELYIDTIAVNRDQHGKGVGTRLLQFLIEEYAINKGEVLGLLVDEENPNASRLYRRLGFKFVGNKVIFGKAMHHLQYRNRR